MSGFKESSLDLSFAELVSRFLKASHPWAPATYEMNRYILTALAGWFPTITNNQPVYL